MDNLSIKKIMTPVSKVSSVDLDYDDNNPRMRSQRGCLSIWNKYETNYYLTRIKSVKFEGEGYCSWEKIDDLQRSCRNIDRFIRSEF